MKTARKFLSLFISVIMIATVFTALPMSVSAATTQDVAVKATSGDFEYYLLDDGTAEITGYTGNASTLTIPSTLGKYTVSAIGDGAFEGCTRLTSITIPNSVTKIGESAFRGCTSLTSVTIPNSVSEIGDYAFHNCLSLYSINLPSGVKEIGMGMFDGCTRLKSITIPNSVKEIGMGAFYGCTRLKSITIPNSVTSIESVAFENCTNLKSITIPKSVKKIEVGALGYYTLDDEVYKFAGLTIKGYKGTAAEKYAKNNDFKFVELDSMPGEINGDGEIGMEDAVLVQKYISGSVTFTDDEIIRGDVNGDGRVSLEDAVLVQKYLAGIIASFPVNNA